MNDYLVAVILGIVEGLTEFLPVSSTGHMILAGKALQIDTAAPPWDVLLWVSQFGAILAVVVYFWRDLWRRTFHPAGGRWEEHILAKLVAAMVPTVALALTFKKQLDPLENSAVAVAIALIAGAIVMEYIDRRCRRRLAAAPREMQLDDVSLPQAFFIGAIQAISMIPGVSRAGASIMGGMALGLTPRVATEFSFYLAIPTMLGAAAKTLKDKSGGLSAENMAVVLVGTAVSFLVAWLVVAWFMGFVKRYRFTVFAAYRVVLGAAVLWLYFTSQMAAGS